MAMFYISIFGERNWLRENAFYKFATSFVLNTEAALDFIRTNNQESNLFNFQTF